MLALPSTTGNTGIQGVYVFQVESGNVTSAPVANGAIQFSDSDAAEINTASFVPLGGGAGYLGTFSLDPRAKPAGRARSHGTLHLPATRFSNSSPRQPEAPSRKPTT